MRWTRRRASPEHEPRAARWASASRPRCTALPERQRAVFVLRHYDEHDAGGDRGRAGHEPGHREEQPAPRDDAPARAAGERVRMSLLHGRWRTRVSPAGRGCPGRRTRSAAVHAHLGARATPAVASTRSRSRALALLARDPVRSAEPPVPLAFLETRVRARLDQVRDGASRPVGGLGRGPGRGRAGGRHRAGRRSRRSRPSTTATADPDAIDEVLRARRRDGSHGAAAGPRQRGPLPGRGPGRAGQRVRPSGGLRAQDHGRIDVGEEARRSRELLERRALMTELGGDEVASAQPLLDDVEACCARWRRCRPARARLAGRDPPPNGEAERC